MTWPWKTHPKNRQQLVGVITSNVVTTSYSTYQSTHRCRPPNVRNFARIDTLSNNNSIVQSSARAGCSCMHKSCAWPTWLAASCKSLTDSIPSNKLCVRSPLKSSRTSSPRTTASSSSFSTSSLLLTSLRERASKPTSTGDVNVTFKSPSILHPKVNS